VSAALEEQEAVCLAVLTAPIETTSAALAEQVGRSREFVRQVRLGGVTSLPGIGDPNAVPEPASWAMLMAGFGLIGATMRRRKSANVVAS
jgi:hypothetical protein